MKSPLHDEAADRAEDEDTTKSVTTIGVVCLEGRVDPLELIRHALEATGATGVGRLLRFDGDDA